MTEIEQKFIEFITEKTINANKENIFQALFDRTNEDMSKDELYATMFLNAITFSTRLSVLAMAELLCECKVLNFDDEYLAKLLPRLSLSVVKGSDGDS